jgi:hypothetical protein
MFTRIATTLPFFPDPGRSFGHRRYHQNDLYFSRRFVPRGRPELPLAQQWNKFAH